MIERSDQAARDRPRDAARYASQRRPTIIGEASPAQTPSGGRSRWRKAAFALLAVLALLCATLTVSRFAAAYRETAVAAKIAPPHGKLVPTAKGALFVQEQGPRDAIPIVLIHGTAAWSEFWRGTIDHLVGRGHRVVAVDLPPFGLSERSGSGAYTRADQAARIDGALAALRIGKAILVGHSFGAGPAVETALRYPDRIAGLVLVAAALGLPDGDAPAVDAGRSLPRRILGTPIVGEAIVSATVTNPLLTRIGLSMMLARKEAATAELAAVLQRPMRLPWTTRDVTAWLQYFLSTDADALGMQPANYARIRAPARIIWGDADTLTPLPQGKRLATLVPGARLQVLADVGHIPQIEDPEAFRVALSRALREILDSITTADRVGAD